jgi:hypothetical protein
LTNPVIVGVELTDGRRRRLLKDRRALCTPGALRTDRRSPFELIRLVQVKMSIEPAADPDQRGGPETLQRRRASNV